MPKRQVESIFLKVNYDVSQCHNSITKAKQFTVNSIKLQYNIVHAVNGITACL